MRPTDFNMYSITSINFYKTLTTVLWAVLSLACIHAAIVLYCGIETLATPYASTRIEAFVLNGVLRIANNETLYLGFNNMGSGNLPYIIHVYNPLSYLPTGLISRLFNLDIDSTLFTGRLFSLIFTLLLAAVLSLWIWLKTKEWKASLFVIAGLFFFQSYALTDFFRLRPETPALFFTFAGMLVFLSAHRLKLLLSGSLFFTAFLFKQSLIAAPIAVLIYLLIVKRYKEALIFSSMMGCMVFSFLVAMYLVTDGHYFQNTVLALAANEVHPIDNFFYYSPYLFLGTYGIIFAIPFALFSLLTSDESKSLTIFLITYFITCTIFTLYMAGKTGAGDNYFSELTILSLFIIAFILGSSRNNNQLLTIAILLPLTVQVIIDLTNEGVLTPKMEFQFEDSTSNLSKYVERYKNMKGEKLILHEKIAIHSGNPVGFDWYLMEILHNKGYVDLNPLLQNVANGKFTTIVFSQHPLAHVQEKIFKSITNGTYRRTYVDDVVSEWRSVPEKQ